MLYQLDDLVEPIPGESPVGINIREDVSPNSLYYQIKDARSAARSIERKNLEESSTERADSEWQSVYELALNLLKAHTKDIEVAVWLLEASTRLYGLKGLYTSFELLHALVDKYWDTIYPEADDEDGIEGKVSSITMLNGAEIDGTLIVPLLSVKVTDSGDESFAAWQYQQAIELEKVTDIEKKQKRIDAGTTPLENIEISGTQTSYEFYLSLISDVEKNLESVSKLSDLLDEKCGKDSPPVSKIKTTLKDTLTYVKHLGRTVIESNEEAGDGSTSEETHSGQGDAQTKKGGPISNRAQAFNQIKQVANYFRKTEPQSLLPFLLDKCIRWGNMDFPKLLDELVSDQNTRDLIFGLLDVEKPSE